MDTTKTCSPGVGYLQSQVRQFLGRFAQTGYDALSGLLTSSRWVVAQWSRPVRPKWMTLEEYEKVPLSLQVRETRAGEWTLITSLKDAKAVSPRELNEIYGWRWHIELDLRCIKSVMQMEMLRCKTPEMAVKEVPLGQAPLSSFILYPILPQPDSGC